MYDLCPICAWEHLGDAEVELLHAKSADTPERIRDKVANAAMYLRQAEFQADDPDFSRAIRDLRYKVEGPVFGEQADVIELIDLVDAARAEAMKRLPQAEEGAQAAHKIAHKERIHSEADLAEAVGAEESDKEKYLRLAKEHPEAAERLRKIAAQEGEHEKIVESILEANPAGSKPFAWTECEKAHPGVRERIERCIGDLKQKGLKGNPYAICRSSVACP